MTHVATTRGRPSGAPTGTARAGLGAPGRPAIAALLRPAAPVGCLALAACADTRPDSVAWPVIPERVTAGSGGGAAALHNRGDVGVTTRTGPAPVR